MYISFDVRLEADNTYTVCTTDIKLIYSGHSPDYKI